MSKIIEIDGSYLEGGGQILRNALTLSCILKKPVKIFNIRANRPNPGLSHQHLSGIHLLQLITQAKIIGNELKSTVVEFHPNDIKYGTYSINTKTAASITLVLQSALPVLLYGADNSNVSIIGGTNVGMAPQVDEMTEILRPNLENFGISFDFDLKRRGYYPKGGGECTVTIPPVPEIKAVDLTNFGNVEEIQGWTFVAGRLPLHLADDMKQFAEKELSNFRRVNIEAYKETPDVARDNGSGVILKATTSSGCVLGASSLGDKQVNAKRLGENAGKSLCKLLNEQICVDEHVQDQLILYMALANGTSRILTSSLTNHTKTAIHVAELMTGVKFSIEEKPNRKAIISCNGIGQKNMHL